MRLAVNAWFWDRPTTGSGQYVRQLIRHLAALRPNLDIALIAPQGRASTLKPRAPSISIEPIANRYQLPVKLLKAWFEQIAFPHACVGLDADVAHVPYWAPSLRSRVPTVVTIHDLVPLLLREYRGGPLQRLYTALVSVSTRSAALVLTDSMASRRDMLTHLDLPLGRVRTIPLAADGRYRPEPSPDDGEVRARYDLPDRYMLYLGGFDVRKNVATTLRAYRWAGPTVGDTCPLVIAGRLPERDRPFAPDPRRLVEEQQVDRQWVHFVGFVDEADKPALYRGAVALIFPSRYEGFGLPPLEAMACGTPVVGSDVTSLPEIVGDGGVLLPPDDAEGMAGALVQLAIESDFRAEMSRRALAQAARFSWECTAQRTLAAYREAMRRAVNGR